MTTPEPYEKFTLSTDPGSGWNYGEPWNNSRRLSAEKLGNSPRFGTRPRHRRSDVCSPRATPSPLPCSPPVLPRCSPYRTPLIFHIFGALAEFERDIIRERTQAGLTAARARGRLGGRPKALTGRKVEMARALYESRKHTIDEICRTLNISRATLYRYIKARPIPVDNHPS